MSAPGEPHHELCFLNPAASAFDLALAFRDKAFCLPHYDTVTGLMRRVALTGEEKRELTRKLRQLKTELQLLGEQF